MTSSSNLFRFEKITLQTLRNLKAQIIHLGSPRNFNDPYDCALGAILGELTDEDLARLLGGIKVDAEDATIKEMYKAQTRNTLTELAEKFLDKRGVSCFTESNDNLLMWSHYADGGRGMCLEFSKVENLFEKAKKVTYSDAIPKVSLGSLLVDEQYDQIVDLYRTKSSHWQYESEWRVIHETAGTNWIYETSSLVGLYFGPNVPTDLLEIVCLILAGQNPTVKLYRGKRSESEFKVEFEEFTYISHIDAVLSGLNK
jgi:hypothetical protein